MSDPVTYWLWCKNGDTEGWWLCCLGLRLRSRLCPHSVLQGNAVVASLQISPPRADLPRTGFSQLFFQWLCLFLFTLSLLLIFLLKYFFPKFCLSQGMSVSRPSLGQACYVDRTWANFTSLSAALALACWKCHCRPCCHKPSWWSGRLLCSGLRSRGVIWLQGLGMGESLPCGRHWSPSASAVQAHSFHHVYPPHSQQHAMPCLWTWQGFRIKIHSPLSGKVQDTEGWGPFNLCSSPSASPTLTATAFSDKDNCWILSSDAFLYSIEP